MIEAVVAARDDHRVGAVLNQRDRLIGGAVHDLVAAGGEALPLLGGIGGRVEIDRQPAPGEQAVGLRGEQRQRLRAGKHHDGEPHQRVNFVLHGHFTTGGIEDRIDSTLPPVRSPNTVPRSYSRLNST